MFEDTAVVEGLEECADCCLLSDGIAKCIAESDWNGRDGCDFWWAYHCWN
jgi:hypothetical protein